MADVTENSLYCSYMFFTRNQEVYESFDEYLEAIKELAGPCEFLDFENRMIRDKIVTGLYDMGLRDNLLATGYTELNDVIQYCRLNDKDNLKESLEEAAGLRKNGNEELGVQSHGNGTERDSVVVNESSSEKSLNVTRKKEHEKNNKSDKELENNVDDVSEAFDSLEEITFELPGNSQNFLDQEIMTVHKKKVSSETKNFKVSTDIVILSSDTEAEVDSNKTKRKSNLKSNPMSKTKCRKTVESSDIKTEVVGVDNQKKSKSVFKHHKKINDSHLANKAIPNFLKGPGWTTLAESYECTECYQKFTKEWILKNHMRKAHSRKSKSLLPSDLKELIRKSGMSS